MKIIRFCHFFGFLLFFTQSPSIQASNGHNWEFESFRVNNDENSGVEDLKLQKEIDSLSDRELLEQIYKQMRLRYKTQTDIARRVENVERVVSSLDERIKSVESVVRLINSGMCQRWKLDEGLEPENGKNKHKKHKKDTGLVIDSLEKIGKSKSDDRGNFDKILQDFRDSNNDEKPTTNEKLKKVKRKKSFEQLKTKNPHSSYLSRKH